jgi:hypothetical protein
MFMLVLFSGNAGGGTNERHRVHDAGSDGVRIDGWVRQRRRSQEPLESNAEIATARSGRTRRQRQRRDTTCHRRGGRGLPEQDDPADLRGEGRDVVSGSSEIDPGAHGRTGQRLRVLIGGGDSDDALGELGKLCALAALARFRIVTLSASLAALTMKLQDTTSMSLRF